MNRYGGMRTTYFLIYNKSLAINKRNEVNVSAVFYKVYSEFIKTAEK